jgi:hypothetical protein
MPGELRDGAVVDVEHVQQPVLRRDGGEPWDDDADTDCADATVEWWGGVWRADQHRHLQSHTPGMPVRVHAVGDAGAVQRDVWWGYDVPGAEHHLRGPAALLQRDVHDSVLQHGALCPGLRGGCVVAMVGVQRELWVWWDPDPSSEHPGSADHWRCAVCGAVLRLPGLHGDAELHVQRGVVPVQLLAVGPRARVLVPADDVRTDVWDRVAGVVAPAAVWECELQLGDDERGEHAVQPWAV